jgi:hypothetical protein
MVWGEVLGMGFPFELGVVVIVMRTDEGERLGKCRHDQRQAGLPVEIAQRKRVRKSLLLEKGEEARPVGNHAPHPRRGDQLIEGPAQFTSPATFLDGHVPALAAPPDPVRILWR